MSLYVSFNKGILSFILIPAEFTAVLHPQSRCHVSPFYWPKGWPNEIQPTQKTSLRPDAPIFVRTNGRLEKFQVCEKCHSSLRTSYERPRTSSKQKYGLTNSGFTLNTHSQHPNLLTPCSWIYKTNTNLGDNPKFKIRHMHAMQCSRRHPEPKLYGLTIEKPNRES